MMPVLTEDDNPKRSKIGLSVMTLIDMRVRVPRNKVQQDTENMMEDYQERAGFDRRYDVTNTILLQEMEAASITMAIVHSKREIEECDYLKEMAEPIIIMRDQK
jgi:hypothetical protein